MIQKLPPPYLDGSLPGQYQDINNTLCIPFAPNRAVNVSNATNLKMQARIKTIATNKIVTQLVDGVFAKSETNADYDVIFRLGQNILTPGQYYKIQLAFDNGILGYYSTVGVFKYTNKPEVSIAKLDQGETGNLYTYTGTYYNADSTEKVYSYRFYVTQNGSNTLIADSGILIHDSSNDTSNNSSDTWVLNAQLTPGIQYTITYSITTINQIEISNSYTIVNNEISDDGLLTGCKIVPELDFSNGRIKVKLETNGPLQGQGGFVISRSSSKDNYNTWNEIMQFTLHGNSVLPEELWTDYTVEQGIGYKYSIQRFNDNGFFTKRLVNEEPIIADFEDMFLYDGHRQLKIRFNPKVTSFKNTVLETKVDTIGGKYPFIFRNGDVKYREFPLGGLISYLSDPDELFMSNMELGFIEEYAHRHATNHNQELKSMTRNTQVDTANISAERNFKLQVLDWLTNGQTKLFRSPSEGNYIVRTMNASLTPNDALSRMIHSFTTTAYEIAEYNFANLVKYNLIQNVQIDNKIMVFSSLDLTFNSIPYHNLLSEYPNGVYAAEFVNVPARTIFSLQFLNRAGAIEIQIPSNGHYKVNIYDDPLISIKIKSMPEGVTHLSGLLDIGYYTDQGVGDFGDIRRVVIRNYAATYVGESGRGVIVDYIKKMTNIKTKFGYFYYMKVSTRTKINIYKRGNKYYTGSEIGAQEVIFQPQYLYYIVEGAPNDLRYIDGNDPTHTPFLFPNYIMGISVNGAAKQEIEIGAYNQAGFYMLPSVESIDFLSLGNGLIIEDFMCQEKEYIYCIEEDIPEVANAYTQWQNKQISNDEYFAILSEFGIKEE